ncbi:MAG: cupin domain-containing protein [Planctomycetes bacterium]|nr:cupin domain-containing protein [Planctomycetota bacterium]
MDFDAIRAASARLPKEPAIVRKGEGPGCSLGPGQDFRFPFYGDIDQPGVYVEHSKRGSAAPLHKHPWAGLEFVADGEVRFILGDKEHVLKSGDFVYIPPDVPHTYVVESETARMFGVVYPGAKFREMQIEADALFKAPGGPDMGKIVKLAASHGVDVLGPPPQPRA